MKQQLLNIIKYLMSYLPSKLPVGMTEFNNWSQDIIDLTGPMADPDSMRYAICSNLIHLPHLKSSVPKQHFVSALRKAAANQVASQVFQDIKLKQEAAAKAKLNVEVASANEKSS